MIDYRICNKCHIEKEITDFNKCKKSKGGRRLYCKVCHNKETLLYSRTKNGLCTAIYAHQRHASKKRKHNPPSYTKEEFKKWLFSQDLFHTLYDEWVSSGHEKDKYPSVDRIDDYKGYSIDNIQLMTWNENNIKCNQDIINGINNKLSRSVIQYNINGEIINEFHSIKEAERITGVGNSDICQVCKGNKNIAGGFRWSYNLEPKPKEIVDCG